MRAWVLIVACIACGARTELSTPPDASGPLVDAAHPADAATLPDVQTPAPPTVLATLDVPAFAITVDETNVYWTQGDWGPYDAPPFPLAMQCEKKNCQTPIALAMGVDLPLSIAVDHENVYWSGGDSKWYPNAATGLFRCAIGGCAQTPQTIVAGAVHGVVTNAQQLFWIEAGDVTECVTGSCASSTTTLAAGIGGVKIDGGYAYWSTSTAIVRCAIGPTGCASPPVVVVPDVPADAFSEIPNFGAFAIDSSNIYWLSHGEVRRCPKDGCSTPIVIMPDDNTAAQCIATDGVDVYWTAPNALVRCPVTGCAKPIPFYVSYVDPPSCLALDATNVYFTSVEHVMALSK